VLSCVFLWTLWQNQFSNFDARRLLRSLAALFGTAFLVKHLLLASLGAPTGGWLSRLAASALEGVTLGMLTGPAYAASTGYVSFFALALYVGGLALLPPAPGAEPPDDDGRAGELVRALSRLPPRERLRVFETAGAARRLAEGATLVEEEGDEDDDALPAEFEPLPPKEREGRD
jgi:hypothetical protein